MAKVLGVLGGLGPMAGIHFLKLVTSHTLASCDQDHVNVLLSSRADIPDRTAYLCGRSPDSPLPAMIREVKRLESAGAELIAIPCNTANAFCDGVRKEVNVPVLSIVEETVRLCSALGATRVGVLATDGTVLSGAYPETLSRSGLSFEACTPAEQAALMEIIYGDIKQGKEPDRAKFLRIVNRLIGAGCDRLVLGCTELSLLPDDIRHGYPFTDSSEALALSAILACGKKVCGFDDTMTAYAEKEAGRWTFAN